MVDNYFYQVLSQTSAITDLVGTSIYYKINLNKSEATYLVYHRTNNQKTLGATLEVMQRTATYQVEVFSATEDGVRELAEAVDTLHGYQETGANPKIQHIEIDSMSDAYDEGTSIYRITLTLSIHY